MNATMHAVPDEFVRGRRGEGFETCHLGILLGTVTYKRNSFLIVDLPCCRPLD